jgi:hypothetical protein
MFNDGGSAFPTKVITGTEYIENVGNRHTYDEYPGMTLRDYFAAKALSSIVIICVDDPRGGKDYPEYCAEQSYAIADAMLKAREQ